MADTDNNNNGQGNGNGGMRSPADVLLSGAPGYIRGIVNVAAATVMVGLAVWLVTVIVSQNRDGNAKVIDMLNRHLETSSKLELAVGEMQLELRQSGEESHRLQLATCVATAKADQHAIDVCIGLRAPGK